MVCGEFPGLTPSLESECCPPPTYLRRSPMPWYWSDDIARLLLERGLISADRARDLTRRPVAWRSAEETLEKAAESFDDDDEVAPAA